MIIDLKQKSILTVFLIGYNLQLLAGEFQDRASFIPATGETADMHRGLVRVSASYGDLSRREINLLAAGAGLPTASQEIQNLLSVGRGAWGAGTTVSELETYRSALVSLAGRLDQQDQAFNLAITRQERENLALRQKINKLENKTSCIGFLKSLFCCKG